MCHNCNGEWSREIKAAKDRSVEGLTPQTKTFVPSIQEERDAEWRVQDDAVRMMNPLLWILRPKKKEP